MKLEHQVNVEREPGPTVKKEPQVKQEANIKTERQTSPSAGSRVIIDLTTPSPPDSSPPAPGTSRKSGHRRVKREHSPTRDESVRIKKQKK